MLRNWILGCLAVTIWTTNYLVYFWPDLRAWQRGRGRPPPRRYAAPAPPGFMGPLPPRERVRFPPEATAEADEPVHHDAEVIPFPHPYRARPGA